MGFKMMGGKTPKAKTGASIPLSMKSPLYKTDDPTDPENKKLVSVKGSQTTEKGSRGAMTTTSTTTRNYKKEGKQMPADYVPSEAVRKAANLADKNSKETSKLTRTSVGVQDVASGPSTELMERRKKPVKESKGYYSKGSNMHNERFGGHSTSTYSKEINPGNTSYTNSPSNPKSGRPNTFNSRELTDREASAKKSRFSKPSANPFDTTESGWNNYLTKVEGAEKKLQTKVAIRNKAKSNKEASIDAKKVSLKSKQDSKRAKMEAFKKSKRNK